MGNSIEEVEKIVESQKVIEDSSNFYMKEAMKILEKDEDEMTQEELEQDTKKLIQLLAKLRLEHENIDFLIEKNKILKQKLKKRYV